ncbi:ankyrin repeat domain-containing protein [Aquimarina sp. SS2-1]|uniref:ankyrin repeat domain-containing protein n=1 Tax=Aquimarina besae TaxID=3342247 RepID=UPI00366A70C4
MKKTLLTVLMIIFIMSVGFASSTIENIEKENYELTTSQKDPFIMAIIKGDFDTVVKMIEEGSDVNLRSEGKTPLMYAARYNRVDIIRVLVGKGAYIQAKDKNGNTAMKFAELSNAKEAMALLKELS